MTLESILARQAGVVTRRQAFAAGLSRDTVDHRVRDRRWTPLFPSVYLTDGHPLDDEVRARAAILWAGGGAHLSGLAAAWWWGLVAEPPPTVAVTVDRRRRLRCRVDVDIRKREIPAPDRAVHRGLAVTALPLTVIESAVELGEAGGEFLDTALQSAVSMSDVCAAHCRNEGTAGSAAARRLLRAAAERSASAARHELLVLVRGSGATGWTAEALIEGHPVDVAFPAARVAVFASGWAQPRRDVRGEPTVRRCNALVGHGWSVLRFTWRDLVERPQEVLAEIARHVSRRMAVLGQTG